MCSTPEHVGGDIKKSPQAMPTGRTHFASKRVLFIQTEATAILSNRINTQSTEQGFRFVCTMLLHVCHFMNDLCSYFQKRVQKYYIFLICANIWAINCIILSQISLFS